MVRLRSGRFDWTMQVVYPPLVTESKVRRRAQEKATRTTLEFPQKTLLRQSSEVRRFWCWTSTLAWG